MEAKYDMCVCGHIRDHHQYDLAGTESWYPCNKCVYLGFSKE